MLRLFPDFDLCDQDQSRRLQSALYLEAPDSPTGVCVSPDEVHCNYGDGMIAEVQGPTDGSVTEPVTDVEAAAGAEHEWWTTLTPFVGSPTCDLSQYVEPFVDAPTELVEDNGTRGAVNSSLAQAVWAVEPEQAMWAVEPAPLPECPLPPPATNAHDNPTPSVYKITTDKSCSLLAVVDSDSGDGSRLSSLLTGNAKLVKVDTRFEDTVISAPILASLLVFPNSSYLSRRASSGDRRGLSARDRML